MAIDLGKWSWIASTAADFGLPILATALGVPAAAPFAIKLVKAALGLEPSATPDEVSNAIAADPETAKAALEGVQSEVSAKYAYLERLAEQRGLTDRANIAEVNKSIRSEVAAGVKWWHWRHLLGYLVLLYGVEQVGAIAYTMFGKGVPPDQLATLFNSTSFFTLGLFGLLGYVASDTSNLKATAITGERAEGIVASTVRAVTGRKK